MSEDLRNNLEIAIDLLRMAAASIRAAHGPNVDTALAMEIDDFIEKVALPKSEEVDLLG